MSKNTDTYTSLPNLQVFGGILTRSFAKNEYYYVDQVDPTFYKKVLDVLSSERCKKYKYKITDGLRSKEQQDRLDKTVTNAVGGQSAHNFGLAVDIYPDYPTGKDYDAAQNALVNAVKDTENSDTPLVTGASFKIGVTKQPDPGHVELKSWKDIAKKYGYISAKNIQETLTSSTIAAKKLPTISPFIESLESFHPKIQYELTRRRLASNTINTYIPFVRLTSLVNVYSKNTDIQPDTTDFKNTSVDKKFSAVFPSIGLHGNDAEYTIDDILQPQGQNYKSVIGFARKKGSPTETTKVYSENILEDQLNIPLPGIVSMNVERSTAGPMGVRGGLTKADIKIRAYSIGQLNALIRYMFRPSTRVVLEFGMESSDVENEPIRVFNWGDSEETIIKELQSLIAPQKGSSKEQRKFIKKYVYENFGRYEIFIGYVVKFNIKYTKNNTYEVDLVVHSVQQFEITNASTGVSSICPTTSQDTSPCKDVVNDIHTYFDPRYSMSANSFANLMARYYTDGQNHIIKLGQNPNKTVATEGSPDAGKGNDGYFISWRFFVEVLLNDETNGILSIIPNGDTREELKRGILSPETTKGILVSNESKLIPNEVGYHHALRSTDPGVLLIYNSKAEAENKINIYSIIDQYNTELGKAGKSNKEYINIKKDTQLESRIKSNDISDISVGDFAPTDTTSGASFLTQGVWINTNAIIEAFTTTDTVSAALNKLLVAMNNATKNYWNLQLLSNDRNYPGIHVVDMGLSKTGKHIENKYAPELITTSTDTVNFDVTIFEDKDKDTPKYIYAFNRKSKIGVDDDVGSEILDLNIEYSLPNAVAVQAIAGVGGPAHKGMLASLDIEELKDISLIKIAKTPCSSKDNKNSKISDAQHYAGSPCPDLPIPSNEEITLAQENSKEPIPGGFPIFVVNENKANDLAKQYANANKNLQNLSIKYDIGTLKSNGNLGPLLNFIEFDSKRMVDAFVKDSGTPLVEVPVQDVQKKEHAFNSSNLTKTLVDLTVPGIGGIELFQSFWVDRVPSILDNGFYIVTKVVHELNPERGWITKIQGRFRFKPRVIIK